MTSDGSGIWNLVSVDASGAGGEELLTRVTGGAFAPAPTPDGKALFFLDFAARGVVVRRLALDGPGLSPLERVSDAYPLLPPPPVEASTFGTAAVSEARPYSVWPSQAIRPLLDFSFGPSGNTVQLGADSADVLGRLHLLAMGSDRQRSRAAGRLGRGGLARLAGRPRAPALLGDREAGQPGTGPAPGFR